MPRTQLSACGINIVTVFGAQRCLDAIFHNDIIEAQCGPLIGCFKAILIYFVVGNEVDIGIHAMDQFGKFSGMIIRVIDSFEQNVFKRQTTVIVFTVGAQALIS